ncbi:hypothetical protein K438DRAFT_1966711 [Mycena galopus ATCC 62051]|nr:hypothetical protein K438DRAFT_1966711 [Mycena galopus ATCC 62051]
MQARTKAPRGRGLARLPLRADGPGLEEMAALGREAVAEVLEEEYEQVEEAWGSDAKGRVEAVDDEKWCAYEDELRDAETHESATGARFCETPPARRVEPVRSCGDGSTDDDLIYPHEPAHHDGGEEQREEEEDGVDTGDATCEASTGAKACETPPARRVEPVDIDRDENADDDPVYLHKPIHHGNPEKRDGEEEDGVETGDATREASTGAKSCETPPRGVLFVKQDPSASIFTRTMDPFNPSRVAKILEAVKIGADLKTSEAEEVRTLLREYVDIFVLSVGEVGVVDGAEYTPRIPNEATFSMRAVPQRSRTAPQTADVFRQVNEMVAAGVLRHIDSCDIKCVNPITLAEKDQAVGLSHNELLWTVEDECVHNGMEPRTDLPLREPLSEERPTPTPSWRICGNFGELNQLIKVVPLPQGDIRDKQRRLSNHQYVLIFDFASGFFAL